jgi:hypothetical protein
MDEREAEGVVRVNTRVCVILEEKAFGKSVGDTFGMGAVDVCSS